MGRQVVVSGRIKTMNESIYYNVDEIHSAITENKQIRFEYLRWNLNKELESRKKGTYLASPWAMTWDDENYYLIAYDAEETKIKHFRVDKLKSIKVLYERRTGKDKFKAFNLAKYSKMSFGMFGGMPTKVKIEFNNEMVGIFIDRFGRDILIRPAKKKGWSEISVDVALSDQFLGWIFALGPNVKITGPQEVVDRYKKELDEMIKMYK